MKNTSDQKKIQHALTGLALIIMILLTLLVRFSMQAPSRLERRAQPYIDTVDSYWRTHGTLPESLEQAVGHKVRHCDYIYLPFDSITRYYVHPSKANAYELQFLLGVGDGESWNSITRTWSKF